MPSIFLTSDTHFGHAGICKFTNSDGSPVRPWDDVEEMNEEMIKRWNETVGPKDKVYHLGDVVINRRYLTILDRLNGDKVLIKGNHDIFKLKDYVNYFRDIRAYHVMDGCILSHIPVHKDSIARFGANIHGHTHGNRVMKTITVHSNPGAGDMGYDEVDVIDPDYFSVCVEHTDYRPISFDEVVQKIKDQGGQIGFRNGNAPIM
jgi:calcineurin-like phosphoesterase family protein